MEFIIAIIAVVVFTLASGFVMDWIHQSSDSATFFREEHLGLAVLNTILSVGLAGWIYDTSFWPAVALGAGTFVAWCICRLVVKRPDQMILWDKVDMRFLGGSLLVGIIAAVVTASMLSLPLSAALWPIAILVIGWLFLFPM